MCRAKTQGGRRCAFHAAQARSAAVDRAIRAARKFYGVNSVENRAKVDALPQAFVSGSVAERQHFAMTTDSPDVIEAVLNDKPSVRDTLLRNPSVDPEFLAGYEVVGASGKAFDIIANTATPVSRLSEFVEEGAPTVRTEAARQLQKRGESLDGFADHESPKVRALAAANTNDEALRNRLLLDRSVDVRERALLNENLRAADLPISVAEDPSPKIREVAAGLDDRAVLRRLAESPDVAIAEKARANPECPELKVSAYTTSTPTADISRYGSLVEIATSPKATAAEIATAYAAPNATEADRIALAKHPWSTTAMKRNHLDHLGNEWHARLADDPDIDVRILSKLARSRKVDIRSAVAMNHGTDEDSLKHLMKSADSYTADAARANLERRSA